MYTISYGNFISALVAPLNCKVLLLDTYTKSSGFLIGLFIVYKHRQDRKSVLKILGPNGIAEQKTGPDKND